MAQVKSSKAASQNARAAGKPKRRYRTADQWREIIEEFDRSNLTRAEFCKDHGIAVSGLYYWQRKLDQETLPQKADENAFVEIQRPPAPAEYNQAWDVELELGHGRILRVRVA